MPYYNNYFEYLQSDEWRAKRRAVWRRARGRCENKFGPHGDRCGRYGKDVHHLRYTRWAFEPLEDLILLCQECHEEQHPEKYNITFEELERKINDILR